MFRRLKQDLFNDYYGKNTYLSFKLKENNFTAYSAISCPLVIGVFGLKTQLKIEIYILHKFYAH